MQAHANDLRSEVENGLNTLIEGAAAGSSQTLDAFVHEVVNDWRRVPLLPAVGTLLEYAERITRAPASCARSDVERLRACGWSDTAIHDCVQVAAYFNYINRIADALGVEMEHGLAAWGKAWPDSGADRFVSS